MGRKRLSSALLVAGLGLIWFISAPMLLGAHHASLIWLLAWAVFWSPSFCLIEDNRTSQREMHQIAHILMRFSVSAAKIFIVLCPFYAAGWLIEP